MKHSPIKLSPLSLLGRNPTLLAFALAICLATKLAAQSTLNPLWIWPGYELTISYGMEFRPPFVYLTDTFSGLHILDASDPANPRWVGNVGGSDPKTGAYGVVLSADGSIAFMATWEGLAIADVSDPGAPKLLSQLLDFASLNLALQGDHIFLAAGNSGLLIIDISDSLNPIRIGQWSTSGFAADVAVEGNIAYVANYDEGLAIIDVSDLAHPQLITAFLDPQIPGRTGGVAVRPPYAYLGDASPRGFRVVDISQPENPHTVASLVTGGGARVTLAGDLAYFAASISLQIIDISAPAAPVVLGIYSSSASHAIPVADNLAYLTDASEGLLVLDVQDPSKPKLIGNFSESRNVQDVVVEDGLTYVAAGPYGLAVFDQSNPSGPVELARYKTGGDATSLVIRDKLAFVAAQEAGLQIVDLQDPVHPARVGSWDEDPWAVDVAVQGNLAVVAGLGSGVHVIDVSDPGAPQRVGGYTTLGEVYTVEMTGTLALVSDPGQGLVLLDLTNPASPLELAVYPASGVVDIQVSNYTAYLLQPYIGVEAVDISDPHNPSQQAFLGMWVPATDMYLQGDQLYLADTTGVTIYNISDWANPQGIATWYGAAVSKLLPLGNDILVCQGYGGLSILAYPQPVQMRLTIDRAALPGILRLWVEGELGGTFQIQRCNDLISWENQGTPLSLVTTPLEWIDPETPDLSKVFYRALFQ